jgi:hypothetical protein
MTTKNCKKDKNSESNSDETPPTNPTGLDKGNVLNCLLPTKNKKLKLSIIIKKNPKPKPAKINIAVSIEKDKDKDKDKYKNTSLLDTLLEVVEQYKADEENKKSGGSPKGN